MIAEKINEFSVIDDFHYSVPWVLKQAELTAKQYCDVYMLTERPFARLVSQTSKYNEKGVHVHEYVFELWVEKIG